MHVCACAFLGPCCACIFVLASFASISACTSMRLCMYVYASVFVCVRIRSSEFVCARNLSVYAYVELIFYFCFTQIQHCGLNITKI